jgi:hypothetical protein
VTELVIEEIQGDDDQDMADRKEAEHEDYAGCTCL